MKKIGLVSIGAFVPENKLTNADLEKMVDTTDEWITTRTGIKERRIAPKNMYPSDMACFAAEKCLKEHSVKPDMVISSTGTSEKLFPYQSSIVANRLSLSNLAAFDLNAACSGMIYAIAVASGLIEKDICRNVLITASEKMSYFTDYKDRASCVLFGDGAAAILLSSENFEHEILALELGLDATGSDLVKMGERDGNLYFWQDGQKVFRFAVTILSDMIKKMKEKTNLKDSDNFYIIPHQANKRIVETVSKRDSIPMEKFILNIDRYGNTSSASIGLALEEAWRLNRFKKGDYVFLIGFGAGLSWGAAAIKW